MSYFELKASTEISKFYNFCADIHSLILQQPFCNFDIQIFKFGNLSLKLRDVSIFRWESDTSGTLSLYSAHTRLKLEGPALEMQLLWCRTGICSWNVSIEGSFMLDDPFSVSFLCILEYISLYFIQNSMQVTPKWLISFSASHIILN